MSVSETVETLIESTTSIISTESNVAIQPLINSTHSNIISTYTSTFTFDALKPISFLFWMMIKFFSFMLYSTAYMIHKIIYLILFKTFEITFSANSLFYIILLISTPLYAYFRYTYLTVYSRLPKDSKRQNPILDTFLNSTNESDSGQLKSYLDQFLSAIKIFGYLDAPVFHELTKSLQTQKIDSGEIIFLDEFSGFSICVEGEIQVYSKIGPATDSFKNQINPLFIRNDDHNVVIVDGIKYQLLNIIKSGAPLSSFIAVLNILTDSQRTLSSITPTPNFFNQKNNLPSIPSDNFSLDPTAFADSPQSKDSNYNIISNKMKNSPELIAIPKNSCTISTIPKESFVRIASKFPKDTSHIIQMILTKLYRVTFQTAHNFLDLTPNIFQTEINLNQHTKSFERKLPRYLHNLAIDYINRQERSDSSSSNYNSSNTGNQTSKSSRIKKSSYNLKPRRKFNSNKYKSTNYSNLSNSNTSLNNLNSKLNTESSYYSSNSNHLDVFTSEGDDSVYLTDTPSLDLDNSPYTNNSSTNVSISTSNLTNSTNTTKKSRNTNSIKRVPFLRNKSRNFVLDSKSDTNPGDLLSNVALPRNSEVNFRNNLSKADLNEIIDRTFSADDNDEETEESTLRAALAERISSMIGLDKNNFPIESLNGRSNSNIDSIVNSPSLHSNSVPGIRYVTPVGESAPSSSSKNRKLRTYSTTSMDAAVLHNNNSNNNNRSGSVTANNVNSDESCSINSKVYKSFVNFDNVKGEFADDIKFMKIKKGTKIIKEKEQTPGIFYVIDGLFDVSYWKRESAFNTNYIDDPENERTLKDNMVEEYLYTVGEGDIAGYLGTLIGSKSFVDVAATTDSYVAFLSREFFEYLTERYPRLELNIAQLLLKVLDKKLYLTDYALEWVHSSAGNVLYKQSDPANGIYIVLNGRFRALSKNKDNTNYVILGEYGQGESMGEIEVLTKSKRISTVVSIRDSELARIPRTLFEIIALSNPSIMVNISRIVANRVKNDGAMVASQSHVSATASTRIKDEPMIQSFNNYRTITLLPVTYDTIPLVEFGENLANSLEKVGKSVKILNQSAALSNLGKYAFDKLAKLKQSGYFSELEEKYDIVIYLCDSVVNSNWTQTCIQQGDCILLLADSMLKPDVGEFERLLVKTKTTSRTELVLLHPDRHIEPGSTHQWLKNRIWVHAHHHIQMECKNSHGDHTENIKVYDTDTLTKFGKKLTDNLMFKMENIVNNNDFFQFLKQTKQDFKSQKYYQPLQEHKDDFMRLARILTGQAIGLVLGGGGARGISHVGVIKALEDSGIPVDMIGGTSIGAFVGGLYAKDYDFVPVYVRANAFAGRMSSLWRSLLDLTIPLTSYLTGHEFNRGIWKAFGDSRIEDFWIKYYTNSTNLTDSVMEVHTSGYAWRYIRASMTLASLLPPLTDDGNMLLDGGYIDNLTVSEMQRRGAKHIIAVDVGSVDDRSPMKYGNSLSGWWVLVNRLNPFSVHANVPTMADIQMRLAYVASVNALENAKNSEGCSYLRPPIEEYATLAFGRFEEIYEVGLKYGTEKISEIFTDWNMNTKKKQFLPGRRSRRRYSM